MYTKPVLILAFNRPIHLRGLIDSLRPHQPQKILVGVDGPRKNNPKDSEKIALVLAEIRKIDWTTDIELRVREKNLGLRFAVADAVSWALEKHGEIIVVEDDVEVGPEFLGFMSEMLDKFKYNETIGHISGYNLVPKEVLTRPNEQIRLSLIPESYAWATWARAWEKYDPALSWARSQTIFDLKKRLGSLLSAIVWKINFFDAQRESINTWAYRWVATLWANDLLCISPNRNLVTYTGSDSGTHTRLRASWSELQVSKLGQIDSSYPPERDVAADEWLQKNMFKASKTGLPLRIAASIALFFLSS